MHPSNLLLLLPPLAVHWFSACCCCLLCLRGQNFAEYVSLYPEFQHVFLGDNGQGDVRAAEMMAERYPGKLEAVYMHRVSRRGFRDLVYLMPIDFGWPFLLPLVCTSLATFSGTENR